MSESDSIAQRARLYRDAVAEARFDRVEAPRELVAFLILDGLERIDEHCRTKLA